MILLCCHVLRSFRVPAEPPPANRFPGILLCPQSVLSVIFPKTELFISVAPQQCSPVCAGCILQQKPASCASAPLHSIKKRSRGLSVLGRQTAGSLRKSQFNYPANFDQ
ncbi:hypothetical protein CLOSTASPAR_02722 [[Clostridium] asparagiforme DSM 15981]|uniref:Uncharacterized protein n=1 Tax=[Clostridium] asparagiforme DSM 15981 TaxID=518636 RepID=C0D0D7_9FIRM|nr:hypothetical protein CLOSTASPAR_02722 [[Clostridium] asparagiforme DSM 15981]